ncbi:MAG: hypothetical protein M3Q42_04825 [Pseudomonadota bacterium]|nr:hypothetical protein [Pseudomonadota bacterium]
MLNSARSRGRTWQWIIGFIVVVLLVWGVARLLRDEGEPLSGRAVGIPVVAPEPVVPVDPLEAGDLVPAVDTRRGEAIPVSAIIATPKAFHGRPVAGVATVAEASARIPANRGFWIEEAGQRIFVVVVQKADVSPRRDQPRSSSDNAGVAPEMTPGQRVELSGRVYPGAMAPQVAPGLDADTRGMLSAQPAFLLVEPGEVAPAEPGAGGVARSPSPTLAPPEPGG